MVNILNVTNLWKFKWKFNLKLTGSRGSRVPALGSSGGVSILAKG